MPLQIPTRPTLPLARKKLANGAVVNNNGTIVSWTNSVPASFLSETGIIDLKCAPNGFFRAIALKSDGNVITYEERVPQGSTSHIIPSNGNIVQIELDVSPANGGNFIALKSDGSILNWGGGVWTNVINVAQRAPNAMPAVAVAAGQDHACALKPDGTVVCWSTMANESSYPSPPAGLNNVVAIASYFDYVIALKSDGTVTGWGNLFQKTPGQNSASYLPVSIPSNLNNVIAIRANNGGWTAIKNNGTVFAQGLWHKNNNYLDASPYFNSLTNVQDIFFGNPSFYLKSGSLLKTDGTTVNGIEPLDVDGNTKPICDIPASVGVICQNINPIGAITNKTPGVSPFTVAAPTSTSGRPVTLTIKSGPATISGTSGGTYTVTLNGQEGMVTVAANLGGGADYVPAPEVTTSFAVAFLSQTISAIATISSKTPGAAPFTVAAPTSTSGLPVTLTVKSGPATISGTPGGTYTVTLNGTAGTVVVAANQAGNSNYNAATEVITSFAVAFLSQTISAIATISSKTPGATPFTVAAPTSTSGLPVTLTVKSGPATISGTPGGTYTVTLNGTAGTVVIAANQAGNSNYNAATEVITSFAVAFLSQTISAIATISSKTPGATPFTVAAPTSTSGLPVTLTVKSGPATISGTPGGTYTVTLNGTVGTVVIAANQAGNLTTYNPAAEVTTSFGVAFLSQTVNSIPTISGRASNSPPFTVISPTSSSGLPVTLSVKSGPATITGIAGGVYTITLTGEPGTVIIAANQSGNSNYFPASEVIAIFSVMFVKNISTKINLQKNDQILAGNTSWLDEYENFSGYAYDGGYTGNAGLLLNNFAKQNDLYSLNYGLSSTGVASGTTGIFRSYVSLKNLKRDTVFEYQKVDSNDSAWASYNLYSGSGMASGSQNVSSYAIEFINKVGFNYPILTTGRKTGYVTVTIDTPPPYLVTTTGNVLNKIIALETIDCEFPQPENTVPLKPVPFSQFLDQKACWTGTDTTGSAYREFLRKFIASTTGIFNGGILKSTRPKFDPSTVNTLIITASGAPETSGFFNYISGNLICTPFVTGDSVSFNLYSFDYTGLYRKYHNSLPVYPTTGFTLNYPQDFTGYQDLTDALNQRLNDVSYPVWYPYLSLSGERIGAYITGSLMSFELKNPSSSVPYISFVSNRNYTSGFDISLKTGQRGKFKVMDVSSYVMEANKVSGYSYLLPNQIDLQAYDENTSSWIVLDRQVNLYNKLTGLPPTELIYTGYSGFLDSGVVDVFAPAKSGEITGASSGTTGIDPDEFFLTNRPGFETIYQQQQTAYAQRNIYCAPISNVRDLSITRPTGGWPTGIDACNFSGIVDEKGECSYCCQWMIENNLSGFQLYTDDQLLLLEGKICNKPGVALIPYSVINGYGTCWVCTGTSGRAADSGTIPFESKVYFLRTGWNLNATSQYLNCLLSNKQYDISKLNFSKYRVVMTGFSGTTIYNDADSYYLQQNSFIFKNINLYSAIHFSSGGLFSGTKSASPIGIPYTLEIQGMAKLPFNIDYNYSISGQENSGVHLATNVAVYYVPTGDEARASFVHSSGKFVGSVTGFVSGVFGGSGVLSNTFDNYYFYNPDNNEVTFSKTLTGYTSGIGEKISGKEIVLKSTTVAKSIIVGGVLSNQSYYTGFSSGNITLTGNLINVPYQKNNILGYYMLSGTITGTSNSGLLNYNIPVVTGQYDASNINNVPYYGIPTGYITASAVVPINFNIIKDYNYLAINSNAITYYNAENVNYFYNISGLLSVINSSPNTYRVSGVSMQDPVFNGLYANITGVVLYSLITGSSGNAITLSTDNTGAIGLGAQTINLSGGSDIYSRLFNFGIFTGAAKGTLYRTGFYQLSVPTGIIYGTGREYQFTRKFENIWAISTGLPRRGLTRYETGTHLVAPGRYLGQVTGETDLGQYDNIVKLNLNYYNQYDMTDNSAGLDVIDLYVTGYNFPSGTGIIFRITGIK